MQHEYFDLRLGYRHSCSYDDQDSAYNDCVEEDMKGL